MAEGCNKKQVNAFEYLVLMPDWFTEQVVPLA